MNFFKNNKGVQPRLGPVNGVNRHEDFIPRVKPFYFLTEKEIATYAFIHNLLETVDCPYHKQALREDVRNLLNNFEKKYPGSKYGLINSFLEILPLMKKNARTKPGSINSCERCAQPTSKSLCKCCELIEGLK